LKLDAVHADIDLTLVDLLVLAGEEIVVAGDVGRTVADVAEEGAEQLLVVERQRQRADRAGNPELTVALSLWIPGQTFGLPRMTRI
jgi:hypothetical protein